MHRPASTVTSSVVSSCCPIMMSAVPVSLHIAGKFLVFPLDILIHIHNRLTAHSCFSHDIVKIISHNIHNAAVNEAVLFHLADDSHNTLPGKGLLVASCPCKRTDDICDSHNSFLQAEIHGRQAQGIAPHGCA